MLRIAALNESEDSGEEESDQQDEPAATKEAEESEAFGEYNRALRLQRSGDGKGAEDVFASLLRHPFLQKAREIAEAEEEDDHHPGLPLLYLVHKNMAAAAVNRGDLVDAMKSYLEAVKIDASEVTVWYKMGTVAKKLHNYPLARLSFEQGLQCNERHWPSLDAVITVLYALNDYLVCLEYCGRALERDPYYTKGLIFMRQILKEQPSLLNNTKEIFAYCDPVIHTVHIEAAEAEELVNECVAIRDKRRELAKQPEPEPLRLPTPIKHLTWKCVGECLVDLYDNFTSSDPPKSLALALDMNEYVAMAEGKVNQTDVETSPQTLTPTTQSKLSTNTASTAAVTTAAPTTTPVPTTPSNTTLTVVHPVTDKKTPERSGDEKMEVDLGYEAGQSTEGPEVLEAESGKNSTVLSETGVKEGDQEATMKKSQLIGNKKEVVLTEDMETEKRATLIERKAEKDDSNAELSETLANESSKGAELSETQTLTMECSKGAELSETQTLTMECSKGAELSETQTLTMECSKGAELSETQTLTMECSKGAELSETQTLTMECSKGAELSETQTLTMECSKVVDSSETLATECSKNVDMTEKQHNEGEKSIDLGETQAMKVDQEAGMKTESTSPKIVISMPSDTCESVSGAQPSLPSSIKSKDEGDVAESKTTSTVTSAASAPAVSQEKSSLLPVATVSLTGKELTVNVSSAEVVQKDTVSRLSTSDCVPSVVNVSQLNPTDPSVPFSKSSPDEPLSGESSLSVPLKVEGTVSSVPTRMVVSSGINSSPSEKHASDVSSISVIASPSTLQKTSSDIDKAVVETKLEGKSPETGAAASFLDITVNTPGDKSSDLTRETKSEGMVTGTTPPSQQIFVNVDFPGSAATTSLTSASTSQMLMVVSTQNAQSSSSPSPALTTLSSISKASTSLASVSYKQMSPGQAIAVLLTSPTITSTSASAPLAAGKIQSPACSASPSATHSATSAPASVSLARTPGTSPNLPKFQFSTITSKEVQALLQDCLPTTPLLSTPAPSSYSASLTERVRQASPTTPASTSVPPASVSPGSAASTQLQSLARLASVSGSKSEERGEVADGAPGEMSAEQTPDVVGLNPRLSPSSRHSPATSTPVSAEVALRDHAGLGRGGKGAKKGTKRKRAITVKRVGVIGPEDFAVKRRSARVRNTRKEEENVDFQKLLRNFLPSTLTQSVLEEEDSQAEDGPSLSASQAPIDVSLTELCSGPPLEETEQEDVRSYLSECLKGQGVVSLMYKYLVHLSCRDSRVWPPGVAELYIQVYERLRHHLTFPSLYCMDFPEICYTEISKMTLVWAELTLDAFLAKRGDALLVSPQRSSEGQQLETGLFIDAYSEEDLLFLSGIIESDLIDLLGSEQIPFIVRVYWLKGRWALAENQMNKAVDTLDQVVNCLREDESWSKVYLPNCTHDKVISLEEVKRQQESLQRCQSLEETQRLFDAGQYQQVVDSLSATFAPTQFTHQSSKVALPERHAQLELLQDALYRLQDWGKCVLWGEVALDEALHHYRRAPTISNRDSWALTLMQLFKGLERVFDKSMESVRSLPVRYLIRLSHNLMRIIEINHDVSETVTDMPIASVLPWILLYRIIRHEEDKLEGLKILDEDSPDDSDGSISSSLMLLGVAHEYLGRNAWCTKENGIFLHLYMDILTKELNTAHASVKDDLETAFEQCVFCLYVHPNKKGKARHLYDHNAPCVDLTWDRCEAIFDYFKPKSVPEFDSYKTSTVSAELENLLRRIYTLIPEEEGPGKRVDHVHDYIEGNTSTPPGYSTDSPILQELYYLLADYYFKNKEPPKAVKFYTYDVCFNSWRIDSWAGLALAKMSQLETKLNSMELKIDAPVHKKSIAALRCFSRAVEIDEGVRKLWIEYGALAYQLHSHASRQLRMQLWFPLTPELLDIAMETRVEMLATARNCYWKASKCEAEGSEEEWLHHYMMGKVMEKKRAHPRLYLEHYKQAAIYLHEEEAKYPRKIMYHVSPPHLSLEALEMYYRLHVAVMKHLLRTSAPETKDDMTLFDRYVTEATESPFALRKEKHYEMQESVSSADDSQSSETSVPPYSTAHQRPVYHMTPQDHNYSKQKSSGGETSDASCEVKETGTETDASQSSEEPDIAGRTLERLGQGSEGKSGNSTRDDGEKTEQQQSARVVEMMELHAETDDEVHDSTGLLFDKLIKQTSRGFVPTVQKGQDLKPVAPVSSATQAQLPITTTTTSHATASDSVNKDTKDTPAENAADGTDVKMETTTDQKMAEVLEDRKVDSARTGTASSDKDPSGPHTLQIKWEMLESGDADVCKDTFPGKSSDTEGTDAEVLAISSELSCEDAKETSECKTTEPPVIILSSEDEMTGPSVPKRQMEGSPQPSKKAKLDESETSDNRTVTGEVKTEGKQDGDTSVVAPSGSQGEKKAKLELERAPTTTVQPCTEKMELDEDKDSAPLQELSRPVEASLPHPDASMQKQAEKSDIEESLKDAQATLPTAASKSEVVESITRDVGNIEQGQKEGDPILKESLVAETARGEGYEKKIEQTAETVKSKDADMPVGSRETEQEESVRKDLQSEPSSQNPASTAVIQDSSKTEEKPQQPVSLPAKEKAVGVAAAVTKETSRAAPRVETETPEAPPLGMQEFQEWKSILLDKCLEGLRVCLSRFPTHYKSIYRLAYLYYASDSHRNLEFARDLLLGNNNWQNLQHMPANGLFSDRRANNFFNGMWKIPIDEIDRSGSFASHVNRSVQLLLEVLRDLGDVSMLLTLHNQLKKKPPDQGRKYLRDGERQVLAKMAHSYTLDAVAKQLSRPEKDVDKAEVMLSAYRAYNAHRHGMENKRAIMMLVAAYQWQQLPQHGFGTPLDRAVQYCNSLIAAQSLAQKAERNRLQQSQSTPTSAATPSTPCFSSTSSNTTPLTVDAGTTPVGPVPTAIVKPFSQTHSSAVGPSRQLLTPRSAITSSGQNTSLGAHHLTSSSTQASALRPAHLSVSRPRALSVSPRAGGEMPAALDLSALNRLIPTSRALDLSSSGRQTTTVSGTSVLDLTSPGRRGIQRAGSGLSPEVIDLTSPERGSGPPPRFTAQDMSSPGSSQRTPAVDLRSPMHGAARPGLSLPRGFTPSSPVVDLTSSSVTGHRPVQGISQGATRSPSSIRSAFPHSRLQTTPPRPRPPLSSPFSSPFNNPSSSAASSPATPRPASTADEASDFDLTSEQGDDELALTSPDRLTSDVRHHFHGDLL